MNSGDDLTVSNAPKPSEKLLRVFCCPQFLSREVPKNFRCELNLTRTISKATMRENNIDSHYNHKLNVDMDSLLI